MKMPFNSIGTDNLGIGVCAKMASGTLESIVHPEHFYIKKHDVYEENRKYVVLIRDVMDKYRSGYKQDLLEKLENDPWPDMHNSYFITPDSMNSFFHRVFVTTKIESFTRRNKKIRWGIDQIVNAHELPENDSSYHCYRWLKYGHMSFKNGKNIMWNQHQDDDTTLMRMNKLKNIYFLELEDLSTPKFLEWLQEKDEKWKEYKGYEMTPGLVVEGIPSPDGTRILCLPHINKTDNYFWENMDLFWKEYTEGKIAKGVSIHSPFYPTENPEMKGILKDIELEQEVVDNIRKYNKRYIKL